MTLPAVKKKLFRTQALPQLLGLACEERTGDIEEVSLEDIVVYAMVLEVSDQFGDVAPKLMLSPVDI